jgi:hypothetical protein
MPPKDLRNTLIISGIVFIAFMISSTLPWYGYFIDELYFIACSTRLDWGYVDQPPLSIALLALIRLIPSDGLWVVRLLPALSVSATVIMSGLVAKRLGATVAGITLTALAVASLPTLLIFGSFYSMNAYEPLIFISIVYFLLKMVQENNPRYWIHAGLLMGLGLEMKHTIVMYGMALILGFLLTNMRKYLFNRWAVYGFLACFALILPNFIWQYVNGFPSLELYHNSFTDKNIHQSMVKVFLNQIMFVSPLLFPIWFLGWFSFLGTRLKPYRFIFFSYAFLLLILLVGHSSRPDRIAAIYPVLIASGFVAMSAILKARALAAIQWFFGVGIIVGLVIFAPIFIPLQKPHITAHHIKNMGLKFDLEEGKKGEPLPQWLADRFGWEQLAQQTAQVYANLPITEQQNAVIVANNYGEAGALELYGYKYKLPPVFSTHNSFHSWGPPSDTITTIIGVSLSYNDMKQRFDSVEVATIVQCPTCTRPQREVPVLILRGPRFSMKEVWPGVKNYH